MSDWIVPVNRDATLSGISTHHPMTSSAMYDDRDVRRELAATPTTPRLKDAPTAPSQPTELITWAVSQSLRDVAFMRSHVGKPRGCKLLRAGVSAGPVR